MTSVLVWIAACCLIVGTVLLLFTERGWCLLLGFRAAIVRRQVVRREMKNFDYNYRTVVRNYYRKYGKH